MIEYIGALDVHVLQVLYDVRDPTLVQFFIWVSELGRSWTVYGIAICIVLVLLFCRNYALASGLAISVASSGIAIFTIKGLVERARPPEYFQAYLEIWYSFPSAHAALSIALYGFLVLLAWHTISRWSLRFTIVAVLLILIAAISFSRIYLGVHYTTDVLAGIALGTVCVWIGWKYAKIASNGNP